MKLWMGDLEDHEPPRHPSVAVVAAALCAAGLLAVLLAKFAIDVLLIGITLLAVALVLHLLGTWLAESKLLSPGSFLAMLLAMVLGGWALFSPAASMEKLGKYVPKPIVKLVAWSESKGWGQRAFLGAGSRGPGIDPARQASATVVPPPSSPVEPSNRTTAAGAALRVSASASSVRAGQPLVLTARVAEGSGWVSGGTVGFYDGLAQIGEAPIVLQGGAQVASLTVTLPEGRHDITAAAGRRLGLRSNTILIVVSR